MTLVPWLARLAITAWVLSSLTSCESGIQPQPEPKYLLYAAVQGPTEGWIAVFECSGDSIVDSISAGVPAEPGIVTSPDGRYFAVLGLGTPAWIFDGVSRTPVKSLTWAAFRPLFVPTGRIVICPDLDSALVYQIPGFEVQAAWARPRCDIQRVAGSREFAGVESDLLGLPPTDHSKLVIYDSSGQAKDSVVIGFDSLGARFQIGHFDFSPDGARIYATGRFVGEPLSVVGYSRSTRQVLFESQPAGMCNPWSCQVTPDGSEVWVTDKDAPPGHSFCSGSIFILDAMTGAIKDSIPTRGLRPSSDTPLFVRDLRFTPDGTKAYVNCGTSPNQAEPIIVIDVASREVAKLLFDDYARWAAEIEIAPHP